MKKPLMISSVPLWLNMSEDHRATRGERILRFVALVGAACALGVPAGALIAILQEIFFAA